MAFVRSDTVNGEVLLQQRLTHCTGSYLLRTFVAFGSEPLTKE
jgi:hypothetical protein